MLCSAGILAENCDLTPIILTPWHRHRSPPARWLDSAIMDE